MAPHSKRRRNPGPIGRPPEDRKGVYAKQKAKADQAVLDKLARRRILLPTPRQVIQVNKTRSDKA